MRPAVERSEMIVSSWRRTSSLLNRVVSMYSLHSIIKFTTRCTPYYSRPVVFLWNLVSLFLPTHADVTLYVHAYRLFSFLNHIPSKVKRRLATMPLKPSRLAASRLAASSAFSQSYPIKSQTPSRYEAAQSLHVSSS